MFLSSRKLGWGLAAVSALLRALAFVNYRFDSDEPQHLHVAWAWTAGLVQYRDVFDNHAPLFHLLTAPLLAALGERSNILFFMRAAMLPLLAGVLACTWVLARRLYDDRVAFWSVVILSLVPTFFLKSLEYRADNLWTLLCMLALVVLTRVSPGRVFVSGLLLGLAFTASVKTPVLVIAIVLAAIIVTRRIDVRLALLFGAGFAIAPAIVAIAFARLGAWKALVYCLFRFNASASKTNLGWLLSVVLLAITVFFARRAALALPAGEGPHSEGEGLGEAATPLIRRSATFSPGEKEKRLFFALVAVLFIITRIGFWSMITSRDFLPLLPLVAIFAAAHLSPRVLTAIALASIAALVYYTDGFRNRTAIFTTMIDQVLRVSRPGEYVMDIKGETIYRPRPYYFVFEAVTRAQMERGAIDDTIPEQVVAKRCYVAQAEGPMLPPRGRAWLNQHFVDLGRIRATGQWLSDDGTFTIAVPGPYVILDANGHARGSLDGVVYTGARELDAGVHRFAGAGRLVAVWAKAFERGHSPHHPRDLDF